jgi:hypothetical protein
VSTKWTLAGVDLLHPVEVIVEPVVDCNEVDCGSIVSSVCFVNLCLLVSQQIFRHKNFR